MHVQGGLIWSKAQVVGHIQKHDTIDGYEVFFHGKFIGCVCPLGEGEFALLIYGLCNRKFAGTKQNYDNDLCNAALKIVELRRE